MALPPTIRNRYFSSIQNADKNHTTFGYAWADSSVITGSANQITGAWVPITADGAGNLNVVIAGGLSLSGATVTVPPSTAVTGGGTFTPNLAIITGSQQVINAGYKAASVGVISGYAYVNGIGPYLAGFAMNFGGYAGFLASNPLVIGTTGSTGTPSSVYITWET